MTTTQPTPSSNTTIAEDLYRKHHRRLLAIASHNSFTPQDAEEALQEAFALFIAHFDPQSSAPPLAWITLTLKRCCWAAYRRQHLTHRASPPTNNDNTYPTATTNDIDNWLDVTETTTSLRHGFAQLKPQEQKALSYLALGYSYKEICQLTGWTYTKVNRCITEGRAELRKHLQNTSGHTPTPNQGAKTRRSFLTKA